MLLGKRHHKRTPCFRASVCIHISIYHTFLRLIALEVKPCIICVSTLYREFNSRPNTIGACVS